MDYKNLTLKEKFGQMILLGISTDKLNDEIISIIKNYKIGGIVLYKKNYTSIDSMINFINKIKLVNKDNKIPLFISIDQENGRVNRFPNDLNVIYNAKNQAQTKNLDIIDSINYITTDILKSVGINMNFAPVLDIVRDKKNKVIGNRSYGDNPDDVIKYAIPFMKTMQQKSIIPVIKHFPGHGATDKDSHFIMPKIKDIKKLESEDLKVFEYAIKNKADAIMVGHLSLKGYGIKPASINKKIIKNYLIDKYNYNGLIVTDDIKMKSIKNLFGVKNSIINSINAHCNFIMIKYEKNDSKKLYKRLFKMVESAKIDQNLINESAKKIIKLKQKYKITDDINDNNINISSINKIIDNINNQIDNIC